MDAVPARKGLLRRLFVIGLVAAAVVAVLVVTGIGEREQGAASLRAQGLAGGIGEIRHHIGEFHLSARRRRRFAIGLRRAIAMLGPQRVVARLVGREGLQGAEIGRGGDERGVVRAQQQLAGEIEPLLRAGGDDDVLLGRRHAELGHMRGNPARQRRVALGNGILQRG